MQNRTNELGQPIGPPLPAWKPVAAPPRTAVEGRYCRLEPIDPARHAADLFDAISDDKDGRTWTYMAYGPFASLADYEAWMRSTCLGDDPLFHAIVDTSS